MNQPKWHSVDSNVILVDIIGSCFANLSVHLKGMSHWNTHLICQTKPVPTSIWHSEFLYKDKYTIIRSFWLSTILSVFYSISLVGFLMNLLSFKCLKWFLCDKLNLFVQILEVWNIHYKQLILWLLTIHLLIINNSSLDY